MRLQSRGLGELGDESGVGGGELDIHCSSAF
jgi:hypothetical protein